MRLLNSSLWWGARVVVVGTMVGACVAIVVVAGRHGIQRLLDAEWAHVNRTVIQQQLQQYEITRRSGDAMAQCVQAGLVRATYLQAQDEVQYQEWAYIEQVDCQRAGVRN